MKTLFNILQRWTIEICFIFGLTPIMPQLFQLWLGTGDDDRCFYAVWGMLFVSLSLAALLATWAFGRWFVQRPWRLAALGIAALLGTTISGVALVAMKVASAVKFFSIVSGVPAYLMIGAMLCFVFIDWQDNRRYGENNRTC